jgi:hypothetical protein
METEIKPPPYLPDVYPDYQAKKEPFKGSPYAGRDAMGYGSKIPTDWMIRINKRWHRVYVVCYSNVGTAYIKTKEHPFIVVRDCDLPTD